MNIIEIANEIHWHQKNVLEMDKITTRYAGLTLEDAYEIQKMNIIKDLQSGEQFVGWKMGLTSLAKQQSVGVNQPIYGRLLKSMKMIDGELSLEGLIHPRVEPEFAFLINKRLEGANVSEKDVWQATECIIPAVEIIDSRYRDFSFNLIDVVADNASSAKFLLSEQAFSPSQFQWEKVQVTMKLNERKVQEGKGSAVMGHPVRSVVELVKMLHSSGLCIEPGMVVLTGGITEAIHVSSGDLLEVEFDKFSTLYLNRKRS
ncbi:2-keto-4-pentenoate hydratase [Neobacillus massiliamazoniensis]|uniref:4-oxalocrotonate decarboxylase n=1 Tax=Neobacillus massiliamazoniensis TaxID=1499688 RepID=A0A0U1NTX3_9BACI|nr:fumarylacetoacetate hydrolase family protein [Neobacillus massiliamazoniensis]CRK81509.1 4-oxalocrotonate decarboxylase [Neobacillus massiliamazoniensis]